MTIEELEKKMAELDELQAETENAHVKLKAQMAELEKLQAETENAHAELIAQIAELKERGEEKPMPPHPRWMPQKDEGYWVICNALGTYSWDNDESDNYYYTACNVFKTRDAAKFALEYLKVIVEMREWAGKWDDEYTLRYEKNGRIAAFSISLPHKSYGEMRFATREDAMNCIKAVGEERLIRYYFGKPEEETNNG